MKNQINNRLFGFIKEDATAGFLVFLLALPLSLGIAKASGFPASMGILTAMIGGIVVSLFPNGSPLSIKGPAAGLITICSAAIIEFGQLAGADNALPIVAAMLAVVAVVQVAMGFLKVGSLSELFPHSAVHGMLAAIGIIIMAKQIPVLLGDDPMIYKGEGPLELLADIPRFIANAHPHIATVGLIGLIILFAMPYIPIAALKKVPAPMWVLLMAVPMALAWHFSQSEPSYALVQIGDFWGSIKIRPNFSLMGSFVFWKYVFMFLFVNSLESLLTVKAVDNLDPQKRKTNPNSDLIALGVGNGISGLLGGLPMISEVVRSSANVGFGAKGRGANFFHGIFLLLAMILIIPLIEMIPNSALAAMLIFAGFRLASPKEFIKTYHLGIEQLAIFLVTILVTLLEDLLLGVAAGIVLKMLFHLWAGAPFLSLFRSRHTVENTDKATVVHIEESAVFTNILTFTSVLSTLPKNKPVVLDFTDCQLVDNPFMEFVEHTESDWEMEGRELHVRGLETMVPMSKHPLATRRKTKA
jgi:MFS superfamily sulfate permease-like transporter